MVFYVWVLDSSPDYRVISGMVSCKEVRGDGEKPNEMCKRTSQLTDLELYFNIFEKQLIHLDLTSVMIS